MIWLQNSPCRFLDGKYVGPKRGHHILTVGSIDHKTTSWLWDCFLGLTRRFRYSGVTQGLYMKEVTPGLYKEPIARKYSRVLQELHVKEGIYRDSTHQETSWEVAMASRSQTTP